MGTAEELGRMVALLQVSGSRPVIGRVLPFENVAGGLIARESGDVLGKVVLTI